MHTKSIPTLFTSTPTHNTVSSRKKKTLIMKTVLVILTSHDTIDAYDNKPTGWYLPELAHPYYVLKDHVTFIFATPLGGLAPLDPGSKDAFQSDESCQRFLQDDYESTVTNTKKITELTAEELDSIDAILIPGGHGPMYDLCNDKDVQKVIANAYEKQKYVAAVCHGPAALVNVQLSDGTYLIANKNMTCFTNNEEDIVQLSQYMPFMLETTCTERGATVTKASEPWGCNTVVDGYLITGQNPASSTEFGQKLLDLLLQK